MEGLDDLYPKLQSIFQDLGLLGPELVIGTGFLILLMADLLFPSKRKNIFLALLALLFTLAALWLILPLWNNVAVASQLLFGQLIIDRQALFIKAIMLMALALTYLFQSGFKGHPVLRPEYFYLLLSLALGGMLMAGAGNLLSVYLATELTSISGYILVVFGFKKLNYEAGIKYLLFGAFASGIMLYGISLLYGITGTLDFTSGAFLSGLDSAGSQITLIAVVMLLMGLFFKISLFPMHLWTPDVYQASPVPVAAIFSVVPKIGGLIILLRLTGALHDVTYFREILLVFGAISIFFGNLGAMGQANVRRMLAYSSIAQAGFLILPLAINDGFAITSFYFYLFIYLFMNYLAFYLVDHMEREQKFSFYDYRGLGKKGAFIGVLFIISLLSLTGLPPMAGFTAKLYVFSSLWNEWQTSGYDLLFYLLLIAAVNTVIALFYYLKIPYFMFLKGQGEVLVLPALSTAQILVSSFMAFMLLFFFVKPDSLIIIIQQILPQ